MLDPPPDPTAPAPPNLPPGPVVPELSPLLAVWVRPRRTMRAILDGSPRRLVHTLTIGAAISALLVGFTRSPLGLHLGVPFVVAGAIISGALWGLVWLYLGGWLIGVTGRWLEGRADAVMVRAAIAWSSVPRIASLLLLPAFIVLLGERAFAYDAMANPLDGAAAAMLLLLSLIEFTLDIYGLILLVKCVGEAHRFSAWRGLGAVLLALLLISVPLGVLIAMGVGLLLVSGLLGS